MPGDGQWEGEWKLGRETQNSVRMSLTEKSSEGRSIGWFPKLERQIVDRVIMEPEGEMVLVTDSDL